MLVPEFTNVTNVALAHPAISRIVLDIWLIRSDFYVFKVGFRGFADEILSGCLMRPARAFYNHTRPHQGLNQCIPDSIEVELTTNRADLPVHSKPVLRGCTTTIGGRLS
jgi:hypothetical protein